MWWRHKQLPSPLTALGWWALSRSGVFQRAAHDYVEHARGELHAMYEEFKASAAEQGVATPNLEQVWAPLAQ